MLKKIWVVLLSIFWAQVVTAWDINTYLRHGIDNVMHYYDYRSGLWYDPNCVQTDSCSGQLGWWYWANMVRIVADYQILTGSKVYTRYLRNTYLKNQRHMLNRPFFDDEGWWALALISQYKNTGNKEYLHKAEQLVEDMQKAGAQNVCAGRGGIYWNRAKTQVGSIANALLLEATAKLYLITHKQKYKIAALDTWRWLSNSGLIDKNFSIYDHYNVTNGQCGDKVTWRFTYTYGVIAAGLVDLSKATSDKKYANMAKVIATKGIEDFSIDGILTEHCASIVECADDMFLFKGIFAYDLAYTAVNVNDKALYNRVRNYLNANYQQLLFSHRDSKSRYGFMWSSPINTDRQAKNYNPADIVTQMSALFLFNANLLMMHKHNK